MSSPASRLLACLPALAGPAPADLAAALRALPEPGALPSPWDAWTLLGLARHRARQAWVLAVVRTRLRADPDRLARAGALAHPREIPDHGPVPDLPGWSYELHGRGCCLACDATGEVIDVDFEDDTAEHFDTYFYIRYITSRRAPDVPEARLSALCPDDELLALAIEDLQASGALLRGSHRVYFRLSPALIAAIPAIDGVSAALADPHRRLWLAAALGDWPWARALATDLAPDLLALLDARAARCRELRVARLTALLAEDDRSARIGLAGLAALAVPDLDDHLLAALAAPPGGRTGAALELLAARWHDRFAAPVFALFAGLDPRGPVPAPHLFAAAACLLLERDVHAVDVEARVLATDGPTSPRLLVHMLVRRRLAAVPLVARGLRSAAPIDRLETAALLAAVDAPWSRRALLAALHASDDLEATAECRAALRRSADPDARAAVDAWDRRHPYTAPDEPPYTGLDVALANAEDWLDEALAEAAEFLAASLETLRALDRLPA